MVLATRAIDEDRAEEEVCLMSTNIYTRVVVQLWSLMMSKFSQPETHNDFLYTCLAGCEEMSESRLHGCPATTHFTSKDYDDAGQEEVLRRGDETLARKTSSAPFPNFQDKSKQSFSHWTPG